MKQIIYSFLICLPFAGIPVASFGQLPATQKQRTASELQRIKHQRNFYRTILEVDSLKAEQVSQIQDNYKQALKLIMADTALNEAAKRVRIQSVIEGKNKKLQMLLSPAQQDKIIPTVERKSLMLEKKP